MQLAWIVLIFEYQEMKGSVNFKLIKAKHGFHLTPNSCIVFYWPLASTTCQELKKSLDSVPVGESFDMNILVSNGFLDVPVLQDICIIIEVTECKWLAILILSSDVLLLFLMLFILFSCQTCLTAESNSAPDRVIWKKRSTQRCL